MENEKYLTEERYQNSKKKIKNIAIIILIVGLLIGGSLIVTGVIKQNQAKKINEQNTIKNKQRLAEIAKEKENLNTKISEKQYECDSTGMNDIDLNNLEASWNNNWFADTTKCQNEVNVLKDQLTDLEEEKFSLENNKYLSNILSKKYIIFYYIGGFIIIVSGLIALAIYLITKRREILAFGAQQVMPVAQEGIEKMAPTVGNAVKEISKGITQGIEEGKNSNNNE